MRNLLEDHTLPQLTMADCKIANFMANLQRQVFDVDGEQFVLRAIPGFENGVGIKVAVDGKEGVIGIDRALLNRMYQKYNTNSELSVAWQTFLLKAEAPKFLPKGVQVLGMTEAPVYAEAYVAIEHGSERELFRFGVDENCGFGVIELLQAFQDRNIGSVRSPLANVPITLPLVATAFEVPACDLAALEVGDILLVG